MSSRMLVNIKNVSISFQDNLLFENLSFSVHKGELLAIIGANGCGKSTILNLLHSNVTGDNSCYEGVDISIAGSIIFPPGTDLIHLPQLLRTGDGGQLSPDSLSPDKAALEKRLCGEFAVRTDTGSDDVLSDGELQKRAIIRVLLEDRDLYLLDEPTNYLDIAGITAFEAYVHQLKRQGKGIILVTHDRTLTDNLADGTILITKNGVYHTIGGATDAWSIKSADFESRRRRAKDIKKKIRQLQDDARAKAGWAAQKEKQIIGAKREKGHISRLSAKMAKRSKVVEQRAEREIEKLKQTKPFVPREVRLRFPGYKIRSRAAFSFKDVCFRYEDSSDRRKKYLLRDITLSATTRDKICLMGTNGSGKSTIIKLARENLEPIKGNCRINTGVKTAYVPQGLSGFFSRKVLLDNFSDCGCDQTTIRQYLGAALIRKGKPRDPIDRFSYGELMRAAIVKCVLMRAEFLFLDEPTSHLDIESIEVLEQLLQNFAGGFLLISHDRTFVSNVAEKLYALNRGRLTLV
jgi:ATP-binding cassette subfamily F protein 3